MIRFRAHGWTGYDRAVVGAVKWTIVSPLENGPWRTNVIPNEGQLRAVAGMRTGSLAEVPFSVVLHALAVHQRSAVLEIERAPLKKAIVLEKGMPVDCQSNLAHETLDRFLVTQGVLSEEQRQQCLSKSVAQGMSLADLLILDRHLNASELYKSLQQNLAKKLLDGFTWRNGTFTIHTDELPEAESALKVNATQLVLTGISKFTLPEEVNGAIGPLVGKKLFLHPKPLVQLSDLHLVGVQRQLLQKLAGGKRIDELAAEGTVPFDQIMRLIYALAVIGIVVPEDRLPEGGEKIDLAPVVADEPVPTVLHETGAYTAVKPEELEKLQNEVMEAYLRYRKQDAFELLGLSDDADAETIDRAYLDYGRRFAPWRLQAKGLAKLVEKGEDLYIAGGRAYGELCDVERRNALLLRRQTLRSQGAKKPARDRFAIRSEILDPEVQFKKGKALMAAGHHREAAQQLQFAYDCDPQNSTYRAELAYCKYLQRPDLEGERTFEELKDTLRIDAKSGLATYYAGVVASDLGEWDEAEALLQRALKMLAPDRRPIEALKSMQQQKKKKKRRLLG